jgi:lysine decarboxylase
VVVARTLIVVLLGLVLAGWSEWWSRTRSNDRYAGVVTAAAVGSALRRARHAVAVVIGHPSYVGTLGDVAAIAMVAHGHGTHGIPLVVDQAWGAHFGFHPGLPDHAISLGADAMVTSAHKGLPAWSQAALVLARGERIDRARLEAGVEATATTSPSGAILASMDAARALLAREGEQLLGDVVEAVAAARRRLAEVEDLIVLDGDDVDPLRIVLLLARAGVDGNLVEHDLLAVGLPVELADLDTVIAVVSIADTAETIARLTECLVESVSARRGEQRPMISGAWSPDEVLDALCARAAGRIMPWPQAGVRVAVPTGGGRDDLP